MFGWGSSKTTLTYRPTQLVTRDLADSIFSYLMLLLVFLLTFSLLLLALTIFPKAQTVGVGSLGPTAKNQFL